MSHIFKNINVYSAQFCHWAVRSREIVLEISLRNMLKSPFGNQRKCFILDQEPPSIKETYESHKKEIINSLLKSKINEKSHLGKVFLVCILLGVGGDNFKTNR